MTSVTLRPVDPGSLTSGGRRSKKSLKLVSCIIRTEKLGVVTESLNKLNLVGGMTVTEVRGVGGGKPEPELYRGPRYNLTYVSRIKVELVIEADDVSEVEKLITALARTGDVGDGKIFVIALIDAMRIRTGERGTSAL